MSSTILDIGDQPSSVVVYIHKNYSTDLVKNIRNCS